MTTTSNNFARFFVQDLKRVLLISVIASAVSTSIIAVPKKVPKKLAPDVHYEFSLNEIHVKTGWYYENSDFTPDEKTAYQLITNAYANYKTSVMIPVLQKDSLSRVYRAIFYDHPELFYIDAGDYIVSGNSMEYRCKYLYSKETSMEIRETIENEANSVLQSCSGTQKDVINFISRYIIENTRYDNKESKEGQTIVSVFLDHETVCAGYSKTLQYYCDKLGIPCIYVVGYINGSAEDHSWNLIYINGQWTEMDLTWADPVFDDGEGIDYSYLFQPTNKMYDHRRSLEYAYPIAK